MMTDEAFHIFQIRTPEGMHHFVSPLPATAAFSAGMAREAIAGQLLPPWEPGRALTPDVFAPNPAFVQVMHEMIARESPKLPHCKTEAGRTGNGFVYVIDQRTPSPGDAVPPEDIIGAFEAERGVITKESYRPNPKHQILSARGFFRLEPKLFECLREELISRNRGPS
jgi:hypothetical protein